MGDGIKLCEKCGNYTTGRLCRSCAEQEAIDDLVPDSFSPDNDADEDGDNEEENAYIDAENHFGEGFDEDGDFYDEES